MKSNTRMNFGAFAVAGLCLFLGLAANAAKPIEIAVCHVPFDTPANTRLITVGPKGRALADHLSHGDWLMTPAICEDDIADNNCDGNTDNDAENNLDCVYQLEDLDAICDNGVCVEPPGAVCPCTETWNNDTGAAPLAGYPGDVYWCQDVEENDGSVLLRATAGMIEVQSVWLLSDRREGGTPPTYCYDARAEIGGSVIESERVNLDSLTDAEYAACKTELTEQLGCFLD